MFQHIRHIMTVGRLALTVTAVTTVSKSRRLDFELLPVQSGFDFQEAEYMMILPSISSLSAKQKKIKSENHKIGNDKCMITETHSYYLYMYHGNSKENSLTCVLHVFGKLKKFAYFNTLLEGMDQKG